jgi:cyclopropane fatty-acyl-phospholipid synthase-like methyltransferase
MRRIAIAVIFFFACNAAPKTTAHHAGHHGNPEDLDGYIHMMEEPSRAEWQKPDEVVRALNIAKGQTVCDVGSGPGYFSLRFAKAVGDAGRVFAADIEPKMLDVLRQRLVSEGITNVTPVLAKADESGLADETCDLIVIVDTFHHFPDGVEYLKRLTKVLKPGGSIVNIDFHKRKQPVGPPLDHLIAREDFLRQGRAAGLEVTLEPAFLPYQYFLILRPVTAR